MGKTRMALEVADHVVAEFTDGVCIVELATVSDAFLVIGTVAGALDVYDEVAQPLRDTLLEFLRRRRMLLILDSCEHLIEACAAFAEQAALQRRHEHIGDQPQGARRCGRGRMAPAIVAISSA